MRKSLIHFIQTLHLETLNELTGVDRRIEAENRSLIKKHLMEEINELKKKKSRNKRLIACSLCYFVCYFNPISTGLFCLVVALGEGCFPPPFHNSFVFKVRLLKFCTEILSDRMNNLR